MKRLIAIFGLLAFALAADAAITISPGRNPATQAEVNAGAISNKFVSPATLAGWSGTNYGIFLAKTNGTAYGLTIRNSTNETVFTSTPAGTSMKTGGGNIIQGFYNRATDEAYVRIYDGYGRPQILVTNAQVSLLRANQTAHTTFTDGLADFGTNNLNAGGITASAVTADLLKGNNAQIDFTSGGYTSFDSGSQASFNSGSQATFDSGSQATFGSGSQAYFNSGSYVSFGSSQIDIAGTITTFDSGSQATFNSGSTNTYESGSVISVAPAATVTGLARAIPDGDINGGTTIPIKASDDGSQMYIHVDSAGVITATSNP